MGKHTTREMPAAEVIEDITPRERVAIATYWARMTRLNYVKASIPNLAATFGTEYARMLVERNQRCMVQWAEWLSDLRAVLYVDGRPPSVEAWAQEQAEIEHYDVMRRIVDHQAAALRGKAAGRKAARV
jgi:hypothetical protein